LDGLTNKTGDSTIKKADWGLEPSKNQNLTWFNYQFIWVRWLNSVLFVSADRCA
jgi:hypothetical protein